MTALEICEYFDICCHGDCRITTSKLPVAFVFHKNDSMEYNLGGSSVYAFNAMGKTCDDFIRFVAKHNLEGCSVSSAFRLYRSVEYGDIRVDNIHKEVKFE